MSKNQREREFSWLWIKESFTHELWSVVKSYCNWFLKTYKSWSNCNRTLCCNSIRTRDWNKRGICGCTRYSKRLSTYQGMNIFLLTLVISSTTWIEEMQAFSTLVTLAPIHDFIFKKQLVIEPYKTLLKQRTQKRREKKKQPTIGTW